MSDEEGDLYGDLSNAKCAPPSAKPPAKKSNEAEEELQRELEKLRQENETLKRNIGTLFRTARAEITRKDTKIEELIAELDRKTSAS